MPQFAAKIEFSCLFTQDMQRQILEIGVSEILRRWCKSASIALDANGIPMYVGSSRISKVKTPVDAIIYGGTVLIESNTGIVAGYLWSETLREGIEQFCTVNMISPARVLDILTPDIADQIIQYGLFGEIRY